MNDVASPLLFPFSDKRCRMFRTVDRFWSPHVAKEMENDITKACKNGQACKPGPYRFRYSKPPVLVFFSHKVPIDLWWMEGKPVLHMVCTHTDFGYVTWTAKRTLQDLLHAFLVCRSCRALGRLTCVRSVQEVTVSSDLFCILSEMNGV